MIESCLSINKFFPELKGTEARVCKVTLGKSHHVSGLALKFKALNSI